MTRNAIAFQSEKLTLEGIVTVPDGGGRAVPMVVVCHPHPLFMGDMESSLGLSVCAALDEQGLATMRFNVRGIGGSQGTFTNGLEELTDIESALEVAGRWPGVAHKKIGLSGYSFSAALLFRGIERLRSAKALALISPPPNAVTTAKIAKRKNSLLVLLGSADRIAPPSSVQDLVASVVPTAQVRVVEGATHTWEGYEEVAAALVARFFTFALK